MDIYRFQNRSIPRTSETFHMNAKDGGFEWNSLQGRYNISKTANFEHMLRVYIGNRMVWDIEEEEKYRHIKQIDIMMK
jgi:hypothetical protein